MSDRDQMYLIAFYVPQQAIEPVISAMFSKGAGHIGDYNSCAWRVLGKGQFKPLVGSNPHIGSQGVIEQVDEYKVELVCEKRFLHSVVSALKEAHPYEELAYHVIELVQV